MLWKIHYLKSSNEVVSPLLSCKNVIFDNGNHEISTEKSKRSLCLKQEKTLNPPTNWLPTGFLQAFYFA